eukprot:TRINITY_DN45280_c0_g1_i2.p1 TRINITY_DN45280_c0_g1~~TRINITY_DN45280_c0_g1_i2.p1  ORF type:complete len:449 (+),score=97.21 TRINITY_DN45280_c0_g1_i2:78-1424(+)
MRRVASETAALQGTFELKAPPGLTLGAIGPGICALATAPGGAATAADQRRGAAPASAAVLASRLHVHVAAPWGRPSFEIELPEGETPETLAIGRHFLAATTSPGRLLRIFTAAGVPLGVLAMAGDPVCLVACEDLLFCVTEQGRARKHGSRRNARSCETVLDFCLYRVSSRERLSSGRVPLSPGAVLRWAGFSAEAMPLIVDSSGAVRALALGCEGAPRLARNASDWLPVAELEKQGARLWPVRAENGELFCAELHRDWAEPRAGVVQRLRQTQLQLPLSPEGETVAMERILRQRLLVGQQRLALDSGLIPAVAQRNARDSFLRQSRSLGPQILRLFEVLAKTGSVSQALDVITECFDVCAGAIGAHASIAEDAKIKALGLDEQVLAKRVDELITRLRERLQRENDEEADAGDEEDPLRQAKRLRSEDGAEAPDGEGPPRTRPRTAVA